MSRRNPRQSRRFPGQVTVQVVCSDRGQHADSSFGDAEVWPNGGEGVPGSIDGWSVNLSLSFHGREYEDLDFDDPSNTAWATGRTHRTYPLNCRRCGRKVRLREESVKKACIAIAQTPGATHKLDISVLS